MKSLKTQPNNKKFFQRYLKVSRSYKGLGVIAQLVSASTEFIGGYFLVWETLDKMGMSGNASHYASIAVAALMTFAIEYCLYLYVPESIKAILYKEWKKPYLLMSIQNILITITMLPVGVGLSYSGAKKAVEMYAKDRKTEQAVNEKLKDIALEKDSTYNALVLEAKEAFKQDSTSLAKSTAGTIRSLRNQRYADRKKEGGSTRSVQVQLRAEQQKVEADLESKMAALRKELRTAIKEAKEGKKEDLGEGEAGEMLAASKAKTMKNGKRFALLTIAFQLIFIMVNVNKVQFEKGSEMKDIQLPSQYFFSQSLWSHFVTSRFQRWRQKAETKIAQYEQKTGIPPQLEGLHYLYEFDQEYNPPTQKIVNPEPEEIEDLKTIYASNKSEEQERKVYSLLSTSANAGEPNDPPTIEARKIIGMYLRTDKKSKVDKFLKACVNHLKNGGPNPFHPQRIGFNRDTDPVRNASSGAGSSKTPIQIPFSQNSHSDPLQDPLRNVRNASNTGGEIQGKIPGADLESLVRNERNASSTITPEIERGKQLISDRAKKLHSQQIEKNRIRELRNSQTPIGTTILCASPICDEWFTKKAKQHIYCCDNCRAYGNALKKHNEKS